jgi:predicted ATPase
MLISISGSQGSGKSTVISRLALRGYPIVQRKVARSLLNEMGMTLEEVYTNPESIMTFQDAILERKIEDEHRHLSRETLMYFTERSYADLFSYALMYLGKFNQCSEWLNNYHFKCIQAQQYYSMVYYLKAGSFSVANDGVRGHNSHYSRMADLVMRDIVTSMTRPDQLIVIESPAIETRIDIITSTYKYKI